MPAMKIADVTPFVSLFGIGKGAGLSSLTGRPVMPLTIWNWLVRFSWSDLRVSVKSIGVPQTRRGAVVILNAVRLVTCAATGISGNKENGCMTTTPGVELLRVARTEVASANPLFSKTK